MKLLDLPCVNNLTLARPPMLRPITRQVSYYLTKRTTSCGHLKLSRMMTAVFNKYTGVSQLLELFD